MNDRQTAYLNKYRALNGVFTNYQTEIDSYAKLKEKVDAFKAYLAAIDAEAPNTSSDTSGISSGKGATKKAMAELAAELASAGKAYANDIGDAQLRADFDVTRSDIQFAKNADAINLGRVLVDDLNTHQKALEDYFVMVEDIAELESLINKFENLDETQGSTQASSKTAHRKLKQLFSDTQSLLADQLDQLMKRLQRREPDLVSDYFNVRAIGYEPTSIGGAPAREAAVEQ